MRIAKAHAYGNDFLYVTFEEVERTGQDPIGLARRVCHRHTGIGADGLILYADTPDGARMRLINPDGSHAEVSGNGVRGLGALLARERGIAPRAGAEPAMRIQTDAGVTRLWLRQREAGARFLFRADMGHPSDIERISLEVAELGTIDAVRLSMGNPQCVVLGPLDQGRLHALGPALQRHDAFPHGVNLELAEVESPDRVRILIWERGAGPTQSSGTGSCASAVAAARFGGASRTVDVAAPGGTQRVEWTEDGVFLTGWAEVVLEGRWIC
jgi:diaminopimelate epimerase